MMSFFFFFKACSADTLKPTAEVWGFILNMDLCKGNQKWEAGNQNISTSLGTRVRCTFQQWVMQKYIPGALKKQTDERIKLGDNAES